MRRRSAAARVGYVNEGFCAGIVFEYAFGGSLLRQTVTLREGDRALYFGNHISWQETKKMLRVDFRPNVVTEERRSITSSAV